MADLETVLTKYLERKDIEVAVYLGVLKSSIRYQDYNYPIVAVTDHPFAENNGRDEQWIKY